MHINFIEMSIPSFQSLSSSISSPFLGLESSRKHISNSNLCDREQKNFTRGTVNGCQQAAHSKLNKTKLKDHMISFQNKRTQRNLNHIEQKLMTESKVSISDRLKTEESIEDFTLRSKSSIKRFSRTEKSRSAPKCSLVSREEEKKQQRLVNPEIAMRIVYKKTEEMAAPDANGFKLYEDLIKKLRQEKSVLYKTNSELNTQKMKLLDQIRGQNDEIKSLAMKLMIKSESSNLERSNRLINEELGGKNDGGQTEMKKIKKELQVKTQKINSLNGIIMKLEGELRQSREGLKIESLKAFSLRKNWALQREQALNMKEIENRSLNSKISVLEMKLKTAMKEVVEKDRFIQEYLMGRTSDKETKEYISEVMQRFKELFIDEMKLSQKIVELQQKIRQYQ